MEKGSVHGRNIILVHGAWHGGWCWDLLRPLLELKGYVVHSPTLPGLGPQAAGRAEIAGLKSHVDAIIDLAHRLGLEDAILLGHSYGGFPATAAARHLGGKVSDLVLLDAFVPEDGERVIDHAPGLEAEWGARLATDPAWMIEPAPPESFGLAGEAAAWVGTRLRPHPPRTYFDRITLPDRVAPLRRSYIRCMAPKSLLLDRSVERVRSEAGWTYREIAACHDAMVATPELLADSIMAVAGKR